MHRLRSAAQLLALLSVGLTLSTASAQAVKPIVTVVKNVASYANGPISAGEMA
jgi:hypothetical protein